MKSNNNNKSSKQIRRKPPSFGDAELQRITGAIPKDLAVRFNMLVAEKSSRLNIELANAIQFYLKHNKQLVK